MRIVGGTLRGRPLAAPRTDSIRPTIDRTREAVFNVVAHRFPDRLAGARVLDLFAGTGALGLEAASRGAAEVLLVEQDAGLAARLRELKARLQADAVRVQRGDGVQALRGLASAGVDLVLLDPPFEQPAVVAPALAAAVAALRPGGWVYLELPQRLAPDTLAALGLAPHRHLKAGAVHAHLLRRVDGVDTTAPSDAPA